MQIESFLLVNADQNELLFAASYLNHVNKWNQYLDKVVKLIPREETPSWMLYEDVCIGVRKYGDFIIIITAASKSDLSLEPAMIRVLDQFQDLVEFSCNKKPTKTEFMSQVNYTRFLLLVQEEVSRSGFLRFTNKEDFKTISKYKKKL